MQLTRVLVTVAALSGGCASSDPAAEPPGRPGTTKPPRDAGDSDVPATPPATPSREADEIAILDAMREIQDLGRGYETASPERRKQVDGRLRALETILYDRGERLLGLGRGSEDFSARFTDLLEDIAARRAPDIHRYLAGEKAATLIGVAKWQLIQLRNALILFRKRQDRYPTDSEGLRILHEGADHVAICLDRAEMTVDPWGRPFRYQTVGTNYLLSSDGPDGEPATDDDVAVKGP